MCVCVCVCVLPLLRTSTELEMPIILEVFVAELDSTEWPGFVTQNVSQWWNFVREVPKLLFLSPENVQFF